MSAFAMRALLGLALAAAPLAAARADDDILKHIINNPNVNAISLNGQAKSFFVKDANVQGGMALEIKVPGASANPWDIAAESAVAGAIHKGDTVIGLVWLRCKNTDATPCQVNVRIQGNTDPWPAVLQESEQVGSDWKTYTVQSVATQDFPKAGSAMDIHLATGKQVIDVGPMFVLNMGPAQ